MSSKESGIRWESELDTANNFLAGFGLKSALASPEKQPLYKSLLDLMDAAINVDAEFISWFPEESRAQKARGFYLGYQKYGEGGDLALSTQDTTARRQSGDKIVFATTRTGWTNKDIGPRIIGFQTPTDGRYIRVTPTGDSASRFDRKLMADEDSITIYEDGSILGDRHGELTTENRNLLEEILVGSKERIISNFEAYKSAATTPFAQYYWDETQTRQANERED